MLEEIDPLPGTENHPTFPNGNRQAGWKQRRLDVGGHIIRAFHRMGEIPHVGMFGVGNQSAQKVVQITAHIRIGVFLDQKRGCMANEQRQQSRGMTHAIQPVGDLHRKFMESGPEGLNRE